MSGGKWDDLTARLLSAAVMVAVGGAAIAAGGWAFAVLVSVASGLMIWELARMLAPGTRLAQPMGAVMALCLLASPVLPLAAALPLALVPAAWGLWQSPADRRLFGGYGAVIGLAGLGLIVMRDTMGLGWITWLVGVVVVSDVAGYFVGRIVGGPKLWPRVSPKKTWSGTLGGWIGAALLGLGLGSALGIGPALAVLSVFACMASQAGDIAESAIKRHAGIKDSSNLIPGHGGLLDRFDGLLGAAVFLVIAGLIFGFPAVVA
ncbi:MAG: phosphatidate cytidylyltransferase [Roseivivax sp.]|nr:phosphatidate cytidylyltransferase [Roseivivax sp.]